MPAKIAQEHARLAGRAMSMRRGACKPPSQADCEEYSATPRNRAEKLVIYAHS